MNWVRTIYYRGEKPSFEGPEGIHKAVNNHFSFIRSSYHPYIAQFISDLIDSGQLTSTVIDTYNSTSFRIGELGFYPRRGNLHVEAPDHLRSEVKAIAERYFKVVEEERIFTHDDDPTLIIQFVNPLLWH